jgi:hypothetical protein
MHLLSCLHRALSWVRCTTVATFVIAFFSHTTVCHLLLRHLHLGSATVAFAAFTTITLHVRFLPDAVVDHLTCLGPVFFAASFLLILLATALGRHAG